MFTSTALGPKSVLGTRQVFNTYLLNVQGNELFILFFLSGPRGKKTLTGDQCLWINAGCHPSLLPGLQDALLICPPQASLLFCSPCALGFKAVAGNQAHPAQFWYPQDGFDQTPWEALPFHYDDVTEARSQPGHLGNA